MESPALAVLVEIGSIKNSLTGVPFGSWILFAGICVAPEAPASSFVAGCGRSSGTIQFPKFVARTISALPAASTICLCSVGANCALPCPAHASTSIANPSTLNLNMIFSRRQPTPNYLRPAFAQSQASRRLSQSVKITLKLFLTNAHIVLHSFLGGVSKMTKVLGTPEKVSRRDRLFQIGLEALRQNGWKVERIPGFGKSSVRGMTKGAKSRRVSIRTSRETWIAFRRHEADNGWVTLSDVDTVLAVSVDDRHDPKFAQVHMTGADEGRRRSDRGSGARSKAGDELPS